jgi:hypothetical protein
MSTDDPLRDLIVDAVELDRQRIAGALRGVVAIDKSGQVLPAQGFQRLSGPQKVLAFLLGRKVAVLLDMAEEEAIGPKELAKATGIAEGTVYPTVRRLNGHRLVSQDVDSCYYLSPHQVGTAIEKLAKQDGNGTEQQASALTRKKAVRKPAARRKKSVDEIKNESTAEGGSASPRRRQNGGFSPTNAVRDLMEQGFFDSPKTLTDVQAQLKHKQGREIETTTLSPIFTRLLRSGALDRDKNDDGAYEYHRATEG